MTQKKIHCDCLDTIKPVRDELGRRKWKMEAAYYHFNRSWKRKVYRHTGKYSRNPHQKVLAKELKDLEQNEIDKKNK